MTPPIAMILAGGLSRRMGGGDKGLQPLGHSTLLGQVIDRLSPQVTDLALNANGDPSRFSSLDLPVHPDTIPDTPGPLAGILTALHWAEAQNAPFVITTPGDTPFLPGDLVPQLILAAEATGTAIAASDRLHPICGLWPTTLKAPLHEAISQGMRRVTDWTDTLSPGIARWPAASPDLFFNVNTAEDLATAERFS